MSDVEKLSQIFESAGPRLVHGMLLYIGWLLGVVETADLEAALAETTDGAPVGRDVLLKLYAQVAERIRAQLGESQKP